MGIYSPLFKCASKVFNVYVNLCIIIVKIDISLYDFYISTIRIWGFCQHSQMNCKSDMFENYTNSRNDICCFLWWYCLCLIMCSWAFTCSSHKLIQIPDILLVLFVPQINGLLIVFASDVLHIMHWLMRVWWPHMISYVLERHIRHCLQTHHNVGWNCRDWMLDVHSVNIQQCRIPSQ